MKLVIDRKLWYRGRGGDGSRVRLQDGCMCCLGFLGQACEVPDVKMVNVPYPVPMCIGNVNQNADEHWPGWLFAQYFKYQWRNHLAIVNDDEKISEKERERLLTEMFAQNGVTVEFIN